MLYFHYCESYLENVSIQIDRVVKRKLNEYSKRENLRGISSIASYTGRMYVLNIMNPHHKIILEESRLNVEQEDLLVYFVRDIINMNQNHDWLQIYVEVRDGKWQEYNKLPHTEIDSFQSNFLANRRKESQKINPPNDLIRWHDSYKLKVEYDIYESEEWTQFAVDNSIDRGMQVDDLKLYKIALIEILSGKNDEIIELYENYSIEYFINNDVGVIFSRIDLGEPDGKFLLLLFGANVISQTQLWKECLEKINNSDFAFNNLESIQRISAKAYPSWAVKEPDLWKLIQKNSENGNLSLLPEQTVFLKEFKFPKYINGQAGSGKSTMLYYLFANAYYYKCFGEIKGDIIFLTENEELLKQTRKSIVELLQCNPEFELSSEDIVNVDDCFISFKRFLVSVLPEEDLHKFKLEKYLDFARFKTLYSNSTVPNHVKNKFSAELVWFSITTYLYGYDFNTIISHKNYEELMPWDGRKLITSSDLKTIEREIIPFYTKLISQEGYWDKIKIIKYIKDNVVLDRKFEVIFCDEAQDFSRIELLLILNLSEYLKFDLSNVDQVPIVFAGDALQTVSPTGFRSADIKDMMYKDLKEIAGFDLNTDTIEYVPAYNYRSSQPIVNVANAIQYYRKTKFKAEIKKPQIAKRPTSSEEVNLNVFLDYNAVENNAELIEKLTFKTFIIPVNIDEKEAFIEKHPFLKNFNDIKCSVEAKGIDYAQVVLCGFGSYGMTLKEQEEYENRFFYNKLYVAVTRAQFELIIIDSEISALKFWKPLVDEYAYSNWASSSEVQPKVIAETIVFGAEQIPNILQSTPEIALQNAQKDKDKGVYDKNPSLLRIAANKFLRLGNKKEYYLTLGLMNELHENWEAATTEYLKKETGYDGVQKAISASWNGKMFKVFNDLSKNDKSVEIELKRILLILVEKRTLSFLQVGQLSDKQEYIRNIIGETTWKDEIIDRLVDFLHDSDDRELIRFLIKIVEDTLTTANIRGWQVVAIKNFLLKRYERSIEIYEQLNDHGLTYVKANAELSSRKENFLEHIYWLDQEIHFSNKDTDKENIEDKIISIFLQYNLQIDLSQNFESLIAVYSAFLIRRPLDPKLLAISKEVESNFTSVKNIRFLADRYFNLIQGGRLRKNVFNFVLSRWAKKEFQSGVTVELINSKYESLPFLEYVNFQEFTFTEISQIPNIPKEILPKPTEKIRNITIENFRKFNDVNVENLGLFNLVVGDNNVGKTSFLEALMFNPDKSIYLKSLAFSYIERRNIHPDKLEDSQEQYLYYSIQNSFLDEYLNYNTSSSGIRFKIYDARNEWNYQVNTIHVNDNDNEMINISFSEADFQLLKKIPYMDGIKESFVPYGKGYNVDLAKVYYDEFATSPEKELELVENMQIFIPGISRVIADTKTGTIGILEPSSPKSYRPLHQYGEGANKLFRIFMLLELHKGKKIMIDEIDAGIHHTRFREFWKAIIQIAFKHNTQIIATTHNEECIKYFQEVLEILGSDFKEESRVVQLKTVSGNVKIRSYKYDTFFQAINEGFELRGGVRNA